MLNKMRKMWSGKRQCFYFCMSQKLHEKKKKKIQVSSSRIHFPSNLSTPQFYVNFKLILSDFKRKRRESGLSIVDFLQ